MYQNYIFDLYGTLADISTDESKNILWEKTALFMSLRGASYTGPKLRESYHNTIEAVREDTYQRLLCDLTQDGLPVREPDAAPRLEETEVAFSEVIARLYAAKGISATRDEIAYWAVFFRALSLNYVRLFPGAKEVLKFLHAKGKKIYLLSNAQRLFTEPELRYLGIYDLFDDVLISSDIGLMKPSKGFYQALLKKHSLRPEDCVMVGNDWQADAWGAHKNGLASMYIHTVQSTEITGSLPPDCRRLAAITDILSYC